MRVWPTRANQLSMASVANATPAQSRMSPHSARSHGPAPEPASAGDEERAHGSDEHGDGGAESAGEPAHQQVAGRDGTVEEEHVDAHHATLQVIGGSKLDHGHGQG